jgi:hypothetical protein
LREESKQSIAKSEPSKDNRDYLGDHKPYSQTNCEDGRTQENSSRDSTREILKPPFPHPTKIQGRIKIIQHRYAITLCNDPKECCFGEEWV